MSQFIETIRIQKGEIPLLAYHNQRLNNSRSQFYDSVDFWDLKQIINPPNSLKSSLIKCRVLYGDKISSIEYIPYTVKKIKSLQIVFGELDYQYKYADRNTLDTLYSLRAKADDIIIVSKGLITDSYYCNLAFRTGDQWITPRNPLLKGTMRSYLLEKKAIKEADIKISSLNQYKEVCLFNAMIDFKQIRIPVSKIRMD